jgi:hypothetical protein
VAEMHRVEGATEDADPRARVGQRTCPSPRTKYLYVVSSRKPMGPRA